jgi:hypothetical protein
MKLASHILARLGLAATTLVCGSATVLWIRGYFVEEEICVINTYYEGSGGREHFHSFGSNAGGISYAYGKFDWLSSQPSQPRTEDSDRYSRYVRDCPAATWVYGESLEPPRPVWKNLGFAAYSQPSAQFQEYWVVVIPCWFVVAVAALPLFLKIRSYRRSHYGAFGRGFTPIVTETNA